jgi:tetratricopeptide (TPR) repeat protein
MKRNAIRLAAAVVVASLAVPASASAQYVRNQDGGGADRNPRLGSGGRNNAGVNTGYGAYNNPYSGYGNAVVTGNVTGGRAFRGSLGYGDPRAFRDGTSGDDFDSFLRDSAGVTTGGQLIDNASAGNSRAFYSATGVANPPPGFVRTPGNNAFVAPRLSDLSADLGDRRQLIESSPAVVGAGGGVGFNAGAAAVGGQDLTGLQRTSPLARFFTGGVSDVDTRVDTTRLNAMDQVDAAALRDTPEALVLGGRLTGANDELTLADAGGRSLSDFTRLGRDDRLSRLDGRTLRDLGTELLRDEEGNRLEDEALQQLMLQARTPDTRVDARVDPNAPAAADAARLEEVVDRGGADPVLRLADPSEQSAQYAQLRRRLDRFANDPFSEVLRPAGLRSPEPGEELNLPGLPGEGGNALPPGLPLNTTPSTRPAAQERNVPADPPVAISSFAEGVTSPTLKSLLTDAERLMADGQYVTAVARYEAAARLVPNQPLVDAGLGTAELAAGYYRRSAATLRRAFETHPELTMARVDAAKIIGDERMIEIADDLRQLAQNDRQARPQFLLAYLTYGAGRYDQAATLLDVARQRSNDRFYTDLKGMWSLDRQPATQPATLPADVNATK